MQFCTQNTYKLILGLYSSEFNPMQFVRFSQSGHGFGRKSQELFKYFKFQNFQLSIWFSKTLQGLKLKNKKKIIFKELSKSFQNLWPPLFRKQDRISACPLPLRCNMA